MEMTELSELIKNGDMTKPIEIILCDDGTDENHRFPKTLDFSIQHFKEYNFDAKFVPSLAQGMSAHTNVERRMAPLSKAHSGVILPHNAFGTHLESQRRTIDGDLEKQNCRAAGIHWQGFGIKFR